MIRARHLIVLGTLAALGLPTAAISARADSRGFRLHIQGHMGSSASAVDIDVPWNSEKHESPFDFTADACDAITLERLRATWNALQKVPEGKVMTLQSDSETILASRSGGFLVLEPVKEDDQDDHHTRIKIPDYIVKTILDHDGKLTNRDLERLVHDRGKVTLVKVNSDQGGLSVWIDRAHSGATEASD
jgi:hypothetical protein